MADQEDIAFDKIMEHVGNDGKFQRVFNHFYNVGLVCFASMAFMNIILVLNEPDHVCTVPGRDNFSLGIEEWKNLTLPMDIDNRGQESMSTCRMFNISSQLHKSIDEWSFTDNDTISCIHGYDYDKTWYKRTTVSDEDWICDKKLYQTNAFVFHRIGEIVGTFIFGQLGDTMGRRPVFYMSAIILILGRIMTTLTASIYWLYAIASVMSTLTSMSIFMSPLIIAMETSKAEDRAHISMMQWIGWTTGLCIMPLVFWVVGDWVWFLMLTTLPVGLFALYPKYMIESPRWLATKRHLKKCAVELNRIAKINGKDADVTEKMLEEMLPDKTVEDVYGIASLFSGWRMAKNTILALVNFSAIMLIYTIIFLNSTRMGGNPHLGFLYQSAIELPGFICGRWIGDRYGRRFTGAFAYVLVAIINLIIISLIKDPEYISITTALAVLLKLCATLAFFAVNLQQMEIFPTCLRQSGIASSAIASNLFGIFGPYIIYLGTEVNVQYPYWIMAAMCILGFACSMMLPETLHQKLPNTLEEAKKFGKDQKYWSLPQKPEEVKSEEEIKPLRELTEIEVK